MFKFCFSYPEPLYNKFRISSSRLVITGNQSSVFISISRFLFAFYSMRFSRYDEVSSTVLKFVRFFFTEAHSFLKSFRTLKTIHERLLTRPASRPIRYCSSRSSQLLLCDALLRRLFLSAHSSFRFPSPIDLGC